MSNYGERRSTRGRSLLLSILASLLEGMSQEIPKLFPSPPVVLTIGVRLSSNTLHTTLQLVTCTESCPVAGSACSCRLVEDYIRSVLLGISNIWSCLSIPRDAIYISLVMTIHGGEILQSLHGLCGHCFVCGREGCRVHSFLQDLSRAEAADSGFGFMQGRTQ